MQRLIFVVLAAVALMTSAPARAQGILDVNKTAETELATLPNMTPALAKTIVENRPFKSIVELNKLLLDQKLPPDKSRELYRRAFVPINLDTGTREEFMLIPGVGSRMSAELMEYRPWKTWAQFDKEIGKYVGQAETDRLKQYVIMPTS